MKFIFFFASLTFLISCSDNNENQKIKTPLLQEGSWRLEFKLPEHIIAPTNFELAKINKTFVIAFINGDEKIITNKISITKAKITILDNVYNNWFEGEILNPNQIKGFWYKNDTSYKVPFVASFGEKERFLATTKLAEESSNVSGKWEVDFSKNNPNDHYKAIGQFEQKGNYLTGTFMTETGDYRFLEGTFYNNQLSLSCFDGAHLFLFKAKLKNDSLIGTFWSGIKWKEPWCAIKNESIKLTNPESLTYLKEGYDKLAFTFPNINGDNISLTDEQFKNKVVIVNIMGPWCPNCKDETAYLAQLHKTYHANGLEIVALSFDNSKEVSTTIKKLTKIKTHFKVDYDFLIAGKASKKEAVKALPMLNHIMSYPTSIFIDKLGNIRKIRTGFYGPATGKYYTNYIDKTNIFIAELLAE